MATKKVEEGNPMVATPVDVSSVALATKKAPSKVKYRCDFKSWKEYQAYKGVKG